jgi:hypothetical protein
VDKEDGVVSSNNKVVGITKVDGVIKEAKAVKEDGVVSNNKALGVIKEILEEIKVDGQDKIMNGVKVHGDIMSII